MSVAFPTYQDLIDKGYGINSYVCSTFSFPEGYKQELKARFPDAKDLHSSLDVDDQGGVSMLLSCHLTTLSFITPEDLILAGESGGLDALIARAKEAVAFKKFCDDLEKRYMPERAEEREKRRQSILMDWEFSSRQ